MVTIIESGSRAWAVAATDGDLHIYSRENAEEWNEVSLSEDSEQIDQDGSLILEALYEQRVGDTQDEETEELGPEAEAEDEEPEEDEPEDDQQPEAEEQPEEAEDEEQSPRRRRARTSASRGRSKAKGK